MNFIDEITPHAKRIAKEFNLLASLIIAQAIHESDWGKSGLAVKGKNLFGIKGNYKGQSVTMPTREHVNGKDVKVNAAFRKYPSWYESLYDLANLYKNGVSWDRSKYKKVIGETDYKKACAAVQTAGYATDPNYATKLIKMIESNNLTKYDIKEVTQLAEHDINVISDWAANDWEEALANGYFDGTRPGDKVTREELACVVNKLRRNFKALIEKNKSSIDELYSKIK
ncbi:muramidase (flagellum-specific) [Schinkia azotoformans MEV2011]|uniref:Muramidase (Flagellum-specific) n=1 Tax=Schinkia azotoformans MEV2011 TaxID=1348973 RepID=A0A072NT30_SCHAZ|nr:muramidase (flagellum-specific) [Schinkia azotoformans MEV2011]